MELITVSLKSRFKKYKEYKCNVNINVTASHTQKKTRVCQFQKKILTHKAITGQYISVKAVLKNLFQGKIILPIAAYYADLNIANSIGPDKKIRYWEQFITLCLASHQKYKSYPN